MVRVSVIIPVCNGEKTIARTIDSALAQNFDGFEIIVVNDGSTDATAAVLTGYGGKVRVIAQPNRGPAAARNAGAAVAEGEFLAFLDADDRWTPDKLVKTVSALVAASAAVLAYSEVTSLNERGEVAENAVSLGPPVSLDRMLSAPFVILPSAFVIRREAFMRCGGFCEEFRRPGFEDTYLCFLAREQGEFAYVPEQLVIYRQPPPVLAMARKYEVGRKTFNRLMRRRYGKRARRLLRNMALFSSSVLVQEGLRRLDSGDLSAAIRFWIEAACISPRYLVSPEMYARMLRPRNFRRLWARAWRHAG